MCVFSSSFSLFILSFSSDAHTHSISNTQNDTFSVCQTNYFMFWVWCRCLLACDDLLRSISEIMVRMYQNTTQERDQIELQKNKEEKTPTQRPTEDEKVEKGVRAHNTIFASRASMCKLMHEIICY